MYFVKDKAIIMILLCTNATFLLLFSLLLIFHQKLLIKNKNELDVLSCFTLNF